MKVFSALSLGRLGNVIFRYLAMVLFAVIYDAEIVENSAPNAVINDDSFIEWMSVTLQGLSASLNKDLVYGFIGYFQHDAIYVKYRQQIIEYIRKHPNDKLITDGQTAARPEFEYPVQIYEAGMLLTHPTGLKKTYDTVVHLRLEDFLKNLTVIHPDSLKQLLESIGAPSYCIVVNKPTKDLENQYIEYLQRHFKIYIESNDVITDYHIMKNAKTLICSCSTLSWAAAFFSDTLQQVYIPNYPKVRSHETFSKPITNTILYNYNTCSAAELEIFIKSQSKDSYKDKRIEMLLSATDILNVLNRRGIKPEGILHVGQNTFEHVNYYQHLGYSPADMLWIETSSSTIDDYCEKNKVKIPKYNVWSLHLQGDEYKTLVGGEKCLAFVKAVFLKVNDTNKSYLDYYLGSQGFVCVLESAEASGWKETLYIRS